MNNMGLLTGVWVLIPKCLKISIKTHVLVTDLAPKKGEKGCILVLLGTFLGKSSANFSV